jgi:hypothetical protein
MGGDPQAQLELGASYLNGGGADNNIDEAIGWLKKAVKRTSEIIADNPLHARQSGGAFARLKTRDGRVFICAKVDQTDPDGISVSYQPEGGGIGIAKLKFRNLPDDIQKAYGYNPQAETAFNIQQAAMRELANALTIKKIAEQQAKKEELVATLSNIVSRYHKTHAYLTNVNTGAPIYVCLDMACDVWDMLKAKGINAKIYAGNLDKDITSAAQANHAWVIAETFDREWIALEATGGYVVTRDNNKRYYSGWGFGTPAEVREFERLRRQRDEALLKWREAEADYNNVVVLYNNADESGQTSLSGPLSQRAGVLKARASDFKQVDSELGAILRATGD